MNFMKASIRAELFAKNPKYTELAEKIIVACKNRDELSVESLEASLPTDEELFEQLVKAVEGKSVHTNILRLIEGKTDSKYDKIAVFSSLLTHASISCKKGEPEYEVLFESLTTKIYESIGE